MKQLLGLIFFFISCTSFSQTNKTEETTIAIACGIVGTSSPEIVTFQKLHRSNDYVTIRKKLINGTELEKLISAVMLQEYHSVKKIILSQSEKNKISELKNSKRRYSLCYTCTANLTGTYAQLFKQEKSSSRLALNAYDLIKDQVLNPD